MQRRGLADDAVLEEKLRAAGMTEAGLSEALRELEGLDYAEIAARLGLAPGTVRSRIHRAKALLRTSLADLLHDPALCALCQDDGSHPHG